MPYKVGMSDNNEFGKKLHKYRMSKLWTLDRLATVVGLSTSSIYYIEKGIRKPTDLSRERIMRNLPDFMERTA
jgi:transcriptional regulator with XRE-family HTH domain